MIGRVGVGYNRGPGGRGGGALMMNISKCLYFSRYGTEKYFMVFKSARRYIAYTYI